MHRLPAGLIVMLGWALLCVPESLRAQDDSLDVAQNAAAQKIPNEEPSPLLTEPTAPEALFDAVVLMIDLERPNLALGYLKQLIQQDPPDAAILRMRDKHGAAAFLELSNDKRLQPYATQLLDRMNAAFRKYATDPARVDQLIAALSGDPQERQVAIFSLRATGPVAIPRMLAVVGAAGAAKQRDVILYAISRMGRPVIPALLGAVDSPDENARTVAIDALGLLGDKTVTPWLWYPAFAEDSSPGVRQSARRALARILRGDERFAADVSGYGAVAELQKIAEAHFRREYPWTLDADGNVELWAWNRDVNQLTAWKLAPETASLIVGSRFAKQALNLSPDRTDVKALFLALRLAFDAHVAGWDKPLPTGTGTAFNLALLAGPDMALDTLKYSLKHSHPAATLASLQVLSQIGNRGQLSGREGQASPILQALNYPDFRVQFAAASTVLQLDPQRDFRGAARVVSILTRALNDVGSSVGLAIDPNQDRGATMASLLGQMAYDPQIAVTGQDGFRIAAERGDVELIVIHAACIRWGLDQTIANLRADARTAGIPVVIYGPESVLVDAQRLIDRYPLVGFALNGETSFKLGIRQFLGQLQTPPVTEAQRAARMSAAVYWLAHIAGGARTSIYNLAPSEDAIFNATADSELAGNAAIVLGAIPTTSSQQRLMEIAISDVREPRLRETATLQLAFHIQKYGVLLSKQGVLDVRTAWQNASDPAVKTALAAVVGSFGPTPTRVTELLQSLPDPAIPTTGN
ncbi:hypothetical protein GC176_06830 [bacterium]|nr:hypothetical protein [bacterium]